MHDFSKPYPQKGRLIDLVIYYLNLLSKDNGPLSGDAIPGPSPGRRSDPQVGLLIDFPDNLTLSNPYFAFDH